MMITIHNLSKRYRNHPVLHHLDLEIPDGNIFALLGPNGSGKSTILKSILEIVIPSTDANIEVDRISVKGNLHFKKHVGYMPQFLQLPPHLSVKELISFFEKLHMRKGIFKEELVNEMAMDAFWNKPFGELSGGMAQKVNILQCFMFDHSIFLLDEPTSGLDPQVTFYLKNLIREKRSAQRTLVFTSHVMSEVDELSDNMALLVDGSLYAVISPHDLKSKYNTTSLEAALNQFWNSLRHEKTTA